MKALLVLLVMTTSAFAQTNFLSVHEASRINKYMDEICPDTYCGGDISFYTQGITCNGDRCSIVITGSGKSDFDETSIESALRKTVVTAEYSNVTITFDELKASARDEEGYEGLETSFTCTMNKLPMEMTDYNDKEELFYDFIVWGCVRELESTVYNY